MTLNQIGAILGVAALAAIFIWHPRVHRVEPVAPIVEVAPTPVEVAPTPHPGLGTLKPVPEPKPAPTHVVKPESKPAPHVAKPEPEPKHATKAPAPTGKFKGPIDCKKVPSIAYQLPWTIVGDALYAYGLSPTEIAEVKACLAKR